jgi:ABC-type uncharacterized transport system ATPase subunit
MEGFEKMYYQVLIDEGDEVKTIAQEFLFIENAMEHAEKLCKELNRNTYVQEICNGTCKTLKTYISQGGAI